MRFAGKFFLFLIGIGLFVGIVSYFFTRSPHGSGILTVNSFPEGVEVFIDGKFIGKTPVENKSLTEGFHDLLLKDKEGLSWEKKFLISSEGSTEIERTFVPEPFAEGTIIHRKKVSLEESSFAVISDQKGSFLSINSSPIGQLPISLNSFSGQTVSLSINSPGNYSFSSDLSLPEDEKVEMEIDLGFSFWSVSDLQESITGKEPPVDLAIHDRDIWSLNSWGCDLVSCNFSEWKNMLVWRQILPRDISVSDWLRTLQVESLRQGLADVPLAFVLDGDEFYEACALADVDFSQWKSSPLKFFPLSDINSGEFPVVVLMREERELSDSERESLSYLKQEIDPEEIPQVFAEVLNTPTGFLNLRTGPSLNASLAGKIYPGAVYEILEEKESWWKLKIDETLSAWAYSNYLSRQ